MQGGQGEHEQGHDRAASDAQRRCQTTDAHTTCRRCSTQGLVCEYRKHNRGRKRKHPDEVDAARTMAFELGGVNVDGTDRRASARSQVYRGDFTELGDTSLDLTGLLGEADGPDTPSTAQTGRHQLSTRAGTRPTPPLAHTPRLYTSLHQDSSTPPVSIASDPPRRVEIQFSHVIPVEGDSSRTSAHLTSPHLPTHRQRTWQGRADQRRTQHPTRSLVNLGR